MSYGPVNSLRIRENLCRHQMSARYLITEGQLHDVPDMLFLDAQRLPAGCARVRTMQAGAWAIRQITDALTGQQLPKTQEDQR